MNESEELATEPAAGRPLLGAARVLVLVAALGIVAVGLLGGGIGILVGLLGPAGDRLPMSTFGVSFLALTVGLGSILAWQAWQSLQGRESRPFRPRRVWVLGLFFLLVVLAGQLVLSLDLLPSLTFPPFHVLASVLPPVAAVALVAQGLGGLDRRRDLVFQISSGAFVATFLAFTLEFTVLVGLVAVVLGLMALRPGGLAQIQQFAIHLQDPAWLQDPANLATVARSPLVLVSAFAVFAGFVPIIEEAFKTIGVGLMGYRRPRLAQAYLWGLAGGAGFALAEGLFNSIGGLDAWGPIVMARVGATLLHCATGALMGLAWYAVLRDRRWGRALGLYAFCVGIHGLWNALSGGMTFLTLGVAGDGATDPGQMLAQGAVVVIVGLLVLLALAAGAGLVGLTWYVRQRSSTLDAVAVRPGPPPPEGAPAEGTARESA